MPEVLHYPPRGTPHWLSDNWQRLDAHMPWSEAITCSGPVLLPWSLWQRGMHQSPHEVTQAAPWPPQELGICFLPEDPVLDLHEALQPHLHRLSLLAVDFPVFRDGRGFSQAAWLRQRLGWQGPLRAVGDVLIDQLGQMARVGFDSFAVRADQNRQLALEAFSRFNHRMQDDWRERRSQLSGGAPLIRESVHE